MSERLFFLAITAITIAFLIIWMFRWEVIPSNATDSGVASLIHFKIDRLTGKTYTCRGESCEADKNND